MVPFEYKPYLDSKTYSCLKRAAIYPAVCGSDGNTRDATPNEAIVVVVIQQAVNGISQISFSVDESVTPKKPTSLPEVEKQRELSGTLEVEADSKIKKGLSYAKCKELSGNNIFGPPPENLPRSLAIARSLESKEKDMGEPAPRNLPT
uniref:DUF4057 domain-containing protein n=1 Tax=Chenopodium quinoa TaxID=63459 RepID=A0A803NAI1_CHEQI